MASDPLIDCKIYLNQYDISGNLNEVHIVKGSPLLEDTVFGSHYHTFKAGLKTAKASGAGFVQDGAGLIGTVAAGLVGLNADFSVIPEGGDAGDVGWFMKALHSKYEAGGSIGQLHKFSFEAETPGSVDAPLVRGTVFEDGKTARTTAGNSAVYTLGAVGAGQKVYAILHLLAFTGTDLTFKLRSAVTSFATITDRITFTQNTDVGSEYPTPVAGSITNTFWRVDWTGTFTSFNAVVIVGIQ